MREDRAKPLGYTGAMLPLLGRPGNPSLVVLCLAVGLAAFAGAALAQQRQAVGLELLLALDASSSVDDTEFALQLHGLAQAFRDPAVLAAIQAAGEGGVAVSVVQWSSGGQQAVALDWTHISNAADAGRLADSIVRVPRLISGGDTSLRGAINFAVRQIENNAFEGQRKVIDVSGDGGAVLTSTATPATARDAAIARGITINGLTILNEVPDLDHYYRENVIGGPGAFVEAASSYRDFALAMIRKLVQEIGLQHVAETPAKQQRHGLAARGGQVYLTDHER